MNQARNSRTRSDTRFRIIVTLFLGCYVCGAVFVAELGLAMFGLWNPSILFTVIVAAVATAMLTAALVLAAVEIWTA